MTITAAGTGSSEEAKMAAYYDNLVYAGTRNLVEHTDYPTLAAIRRGLRKGILAIPYIDMRAAGICPEDYHTLDDCIDAYLCQEYGWDGSIATLCKIKIV